MLHASSGFEMNEHFVLHLRFLQRNSGGNVGFYLIPDCILCIIECASQISFYLMQKQLAAAESLICIRHVGIRLVSLLFCSRYIVPALGYAGIIEGRKYGQSMGT